MPANAARRRRWFRPIRSRHGTVDEDSVLGVHGPTARGSTLRRFACGAPFRALLVSSLVTRGAGAQVPPPPRDPEGPAASPAAPEAQAAAPPPAGTAAPPTITPPHPLSETHVEYPTGASG